MVLEVNNLFEVKGVCHVAIHSSLLYICMSQALRADGKLHFQLRQFQHRKLI